MNLVLRCPVCPPGLQQAAKGDMVTTVLFLITAGAEVNAQGGQYGNALQAASWRGDEQVVCLLIENEAEVADMLSRLLN